MNTDSLAWSALSGRVDECRPFNRNSRRHSACYLFKKKRNERDKIPSLFFVGPWSLREPWTVSASCHCSTKVDTSWLAAPLHQLTHYWPHNLWHNAFFPSLVQAFPFFSALHSVCLIQAAHWVNVWTPLAERARSVGGISEGHTTDWLNMALFLTNWLLIRGVFIPSLSFSLSLQILQERGSRMWRGLSMMSSRCYDANISSLWTSVWHNGDLRGIVHWFCFF